MRQLALLAFAFFVAATACAEEAPIKILFLGDKGHHKPEERFRQLQPVLAKRGIDLTYTDKVDALSAKTLAPYDGLMIFANHTKWTPENEAALIEYVESGKGFIPLHCASYCFIDSKKYVDLVGAQFQRHNTGTFRTILAEPDHPIMKGFKGFESWDETYVHTKHNEKDRTVLEYRAEGKGKEPWTWVRTQGKGRIFYTAWGHDERTWGNAGFQNLVERGVRWAVGKDPSAAGGYIRDGKPEITPKRKDVKPFEYVEANIPFYAPRGGGERPKQMQKPLDAAESVKHFVTPVDFEVKPFVTEEKLGGKPIAMTWDERGRLWVAITMDYPNEMKPQGEGRDRIVICEDTKGEGVCDKVTLFADKLSIPTSLLCYNGGVIVTQAPNTLFLKDTKGEGKADLRQVLFTGWGTGDTHAGPSNLRHGLDGWVYGMVGYSAFNGEVAGERINFRQGLYRFKMEKDGSDAHKLKVTKLEFLRSTSNNSWGVGFTEEGLLFGSTANGCSNVFMSIPNRYYELVRGLIAGVLPNIAYDNHIEPITEKVRQVDWHGGFTAAAGHEIYTARTYPKEYWNRVAFVSEPTGHLTATMVLTPNGTNFAAKYGWNLIASDDEWSAPIDAQVGPDGHVWAIDWYNYIVQHNPTPPGFKNGKGNAYETELRDKKHGRIYRVVYKPGEPSGISRRVPFTLKDATPEQLVSALKSPTMTWRLHAQRLLIERGKKDVVPELLKIAADPSIDEIGLNPSVIHALWTLAALDGSDPKVNSAAVDALKHKSAGVRRNALQVLPRKIESATAIQASGILKDSEPQVLLAALLALADLPSSAEAARSVIQVLANESNTKDRGIADAATAAAAAHAEHFLKEIGQKESKTVPPTIVAIVSEHLARGAESKEWPAILTRLKELSPETSEAVLAGLAKGWPKGRKLELSPEMEKGIVELFPKLSANGRGNLLRLSQTWGSNALEKHGKEIAEGFLVQLRDEKTSDGARISAATNLIDFRKTDDETAKEVLKLINPATSPELTQGLLDAVSRSDAKETPAELLKRLGSLTPTARRTVISLFLLRRDWTPALLKTMEEGILAVADLTLDQQRALAGHTDKAVAARARKILAKGGGLPSPDREKVIKEFLEVTKKKGDAEAGKVVYKNQCSKCHVHGTEGNRIGPDLTGVAVHSKEHILIDILDPSRSVEGNYREYKVTTIDGKSISGLLASETKTTIEVIDGEAKKHTIARPDIEELRASVKSFMPEGFEKQFKGDDLANLLEFLTVKGKYLPIPLDKAATVVSTKGMFNAEDSTVERMIFRDWTPKLFEGVPFQLVNPNGDKSKNVILLHSENGIVPPTMPKSVTVPCNTAAKQIHLLSGVSGWGATSAGRRGVSMIVRLHYEDGKTEDHELRDGEHFADYIRRIDVPGSKFAFALRGQQIRYLAVTPKRETPIKEIEFVKGSDRSAPIVMAVTVETR